MQDLRCWKCGAPVEGLFCGSCDSLQRPRRDYYELMGLDRCLSLDSGDLQRRFYALSRRLHPDRFTRRPEIEREYSLEASAILNDAYRTLRDPVLRAEYVLKENGFDIGEQRTGDVPPELLEEVFELNMALEELKSGDDSARPQLQSARERFLEMRAEIDGEIETLFQKWDAGGGRETLGAIRALLNRRRYIRNLLNEVEASLQPVG